MDFLKECGLSDQDITYLHDNYEDYIIANAIYKEDNIIQVINYFKELGINNIINLIKIRLDVFLINVDKIKAMCNKYNREELVDILNEDFSVFDNLEG